MSTRPYTPSPYTTRFRSEGKALFSCDHVMGLSTTVMSPPDRDMADYMRSLEKLLERDERIYYPTHGAPGDSPRRLVRGMLTHRKQREYQIVALLKEGVKHKIGRAHV